MGKTLKSEYFRGYYLFIGFHLLFFIIIIFNLDRETSIEAILEGNYHNPLIAFSLPIIAFLINGILPPNLKETIVFWKIKNPLPGCRAFSKLAPQDSRIDLEVIKGNCGEIPSDPAKQNSYWYKIYKRHQDDASVRDAHRNYLFARDLTCFCSLYVLIWFVALFILPIGLGFLIITLVIAEFLILMVAARNYANRFVCNVLAEESAVIKK